MTKKTPILVALALASLLVGCRAPAGSHPEIEVPDASDPGNHPRASLSGFHPPPLYFEPHLGQEA